MTSANAGFSGTQFSCCNTCERGPGRRCHTIQRAAPLPPAWQQQGRKCGKSFSLPICWCQPSRTAAEAEAWLRLPRDRRNPAPMGCFLRLPLINRMSAFGA